MKRAFILTLVSVILLNSPAASQTHRRAAPRRQSAPRRGANASKPAAPKPAGDTQTGRSRLAGQIKTLTQFLYLMGGIAKGIEAADLAARNREASPAVVEQNERNKTRVRESIRNVRDGLDKLERDFRGDPGLKTYYQYLAGVAAIAETAENQAAANRFDEAGRSLLKAVNQLADALAAMR
ncbi:MAG TPA: hypothetical protein VF762_21800 [Blastocatellia bacterium]